MSWVAAGEIPTVRLGERCLRFSVDDLRRWVASRSTWPTEMTIAGSESSAISTGVSGANRNGNAKRAANGQGGDAE
jgi:hypothetical protein